MSELWREARTYLRPWLMIDDAECSALYDPPPITHVRATDNIVSGGLPWSSKRFWFKWLVILKALGGIRLSGFPVILVSVRTVPASLPMLCPNVWSACRYSSAAAHSRGSAWTHGFC